MVNYLSLFLFLTLISINKSESNDDNNENINTKAPNYRLINELAQQLFGSNDDSPPQEVQFRPFTRYDTKDRLKTSGGNHPNPVTGNSNFGVKRFVPIGGYPPNNMWGGQHGGQSMFGAQNSGQNMFGPQYSGQNMFGPQHSGQNMFGAQNSGQHMFGAQHQFNSPYNQVQSNSMLSHLMPQTFNMMNSLRAGLKTGIPAYGFGYGIINDGFFAANNGFPLNMPFRSSPSDENSDQKPSFPETSHSPNKISHRKA